MNTFQAFGPALLLGLFGSAHCIGMCGGLSAALAFALPPRTTPARRLMLLGLMGVGRITSYALLGALGGALLPATTASGLPLARIAAGVLLVLMGLSIGGWNVALAPLERAGHRLWQRIGPRAIGLARLDSGGGALVAGAVWGWLPCGLVYSTLAWSASGGDALRGATLMAGFGLGTLPAVMASGALAAGLRTMLQKRGLRILIAILMMGFGIWTMVQPVAHGMHGSHQHSPMQMHHEAQGLPDHEGHGSHTHPHQKR